jgi:hypothetical protein
MIVAGLRWLRYCYDLTARLRSSVVAHYVEWYFDSPSVCYNRRVLPQDAQKGRSGRPQAYPQGYVEDFDEPSTMHGNRRSSVRQGWASKKSECFSIF